MPTDSEEKLISEAHKIVARDRWEKTSLRRKLMQGQLLKMGRLRAKGWLMCTVCGRGMKRDQNGKYIHVNKRVKDHDPKA